MHAPIPTYQEVITALFDQGIIARFQGSNQLVVSRQTGPVFPDHGNSFWITMQDKRWFLCTWAPAGYAVSIASNIVPLCLEFMAIGNAAASDVPDNIVHEFNLRKLSPDEINQLLVRLNQ